MKFTARFMWGVEGEVTWEDGKLSGDSDLVRVIESTAHNLEGTPVGLPTGPKTTTDHLKDPFSALAIMRFHLPNPIRFLGASGDVPTLPPVPPGAIP